MQEFLSEISRQAGALALEYYKKGVKSSLKTSRLDLLTEADVAVSKFLVNAIHEKYPDHHIYSEEMAEEINSGAEYEWVIDPIDGTWNFANHIPNWGILIAVVERGVTKYAATYWPVDDHLYTAEKGGGAFLNGAKISVSSCAKLRDSVGYFHASAKNEHGEQFSCFWKRFYDEGVRIRNYACMNGAMLTARGAFDFFVNNAGFDYDYLAPILIAEEAGALVTDSLGNPWKRGNKDLVIAGPELHKKILALFN